MSIEKIRASLKQCQNIVIAGGLAQPLGLLKALAPIDYSHKVIDLAIPGLGESSCHFFSNEAQFSNSFILPDYQTLWPKNKIDFIPTHHYQRSKFLRNKQKIDTLIFQVAPTSHHDIYSMPPHLDFVPDLLKIAKKIIVEVNNQLPIFDNSPTISRAEIDLTYYSSEPLVQIKPREPNARACKIGQHVASYINDGDCLQIGIGSVPTATLQALSNHKNLGIHSGMLNPAVVPLIESGVINNQQKSIDQGKTVTGFIAGDTSFYSWVQQQTSVIFRPISYTHSPAILAQIKNFVAINTALEIDLFGQVNSEIMAGKQASGSGGLMDFVRGSTLSENGRNIIALPSTTMNNSISRIVPQLNGPITMLRNDIDILATEHGIKCLQGLSLDAKAEAIISLAAPSYRESLQTSWLSIRTKLTGG